MFSSHPLVPYAGADLEAGCVSASCCLGAERSTLGKHRKPATKKWGRYVTTGVALEAATLFAFAYATDSHVPGASLLAQTSIFVDGTKSITGNEEGVPFFRMADSFKGGYRQSIADDNVFIEYPRSLGPLTGLGDPT